MGPCHDQFGLADLPSVPVAVAVAEVAVSGLGSEESELEAAAEVVASVLALPLSQGPDAAPELAGA